MHRIALLSVPLFALALNAQAAPFANGDAAAGKTLHAKQCAGCHAARFGGDGSKIYTRPDRRSKTPSALAQMITTCNANLGNNLFPEDEANLGAFLNNAYYKFK
jgi:mono/diheme cytochrome c family protein